ncbi:hypothetical protein IU471_18545 [Nocardia elegans]|uniref:hypothetical protein n=1 Tax=Nocardia elegans TaxID=300029 RepID=UPI001894E045|nr:hypothetical protein [Nocardia elegans]MBF6245568.1 hypothetical protein [Nocardia elegans]
MAERVAGRNRVVTRLRHIRIEAGPLKLDYQAGAEQARDVASALTQLRSDLTVTVDDELCLDLPHLPCAGLWS